MESMICIITKQEIYKHRYSTGREEELQGKREDGLVLQENINGTTRR